MLWKFIECYFQVNFPLSFKCYNTSHFLKMLACTKANCCDSVRPCEASMAPPAGSLVPGSKAKNHSSIFFCFLYTFILKSQVNIQTSKASYISTFKHTCPYFVQIVTSVTPNDSDRTSPSLNLLQWIVQIFCNFTAFAFVQRNSRNGTKLTYWFISSNGDVKED